jgi:hypothetical protein
VERRAKTHFGREGPIAWFGSAQSLAWGSGEHVLARRTQEGNDKHRLRNRLGDDDGRRRLHERLNGRRATALFFAAVLAAVTLRRCAVVVVGSRGVLVRLGGVRVPLLMRGGYGGVLVNRTGMGGAGSAVARAVANAAHAADSDAHERQQRARPRENAEQGAGSRLRRNFHLQSLANLALGHFEWVSQSLAAPTANVTAASIQGVGGRALADFLFWKCLLLIMA